MLENILSNYTNYINARKGAADAYSEGLKELNENFKGALYESKLEALKAVHRDTIAALEKEYINPIKEAFTMAKKAVRTASVKPIPDDVRNSLAAFDGLKVSKEEKAQILEMTKHSYLARKRAIEILNVTVTEDDLSPSIDTVITDIEFIENIIIRSLNESVNHYDVRLISHGELVNNVQKEVTTFCDLYGLNE